jgi:hypothetical protein
MNTPLLLDVGQMIWIADSPKMRGGQGDIAHYTTHNRGDWCELCNCCV